MSDFLITDFGATADGLFNNSSAIQQAIDAASTVEVGLSSQRAAHS